jgi:hypothetical protein
VGAALVILGLDAASAGLADADHLARELRDRFGLGEATVACTHLIRGDAPHVALSLEVPESFGLSTVDVHGGQIGVVFGSQWLGPAELVAGAAEAVAAHNARSSGRAVVYPGVAVLTGTVTVGALLAGSAIERIAVLAGAEPPSDEDLVQTRDHVRPEWRDGVLTLTTTPVGPGVFAPFEIPNPTPCCADHA